MRWKNVSGIIIVTALLLLVSQFLIQPVMASSNSINNSCADCHRKLVFTTEEQRKFVDIRIKHLESGISCSIVCHEDKLNKSIASTYAMWSISTHALFEVTCDKCHGGNKLANTKTEAHVGISNKSIVRAVTPEMCGKCHVPELEEFKSSSHFKKLESTEEGPAPACVTCHQAHSVRVLTSSEIEDFCSNCHNRITGIDPAVPKKAEAALSSVKELQNEIAKARSLIITTKSKGENVKEAEASLESARSVLKHIPSVWHRFNLSYFETEVQKGISDAKNAEKHVPSTEKTTEPAKSPGFEGLLLITGLIAIYLLKRH
ncbi:MAG: cytochrome c3 family protein [Candidatus Methanoperedens sp.]|nr:cytochrome c3 family protein [Candidatus Methanoperedens sp.]